MPFSFIQIGDLGLVADSLPSLCASLVHGTRDRDGGPAGANVLTGADALDRSAADWRQIEAEGGAATPFQSLAIASAAAKAHQARGERLRIVVVREAGRPLVVLPAAVGSVMGLRVIRFLGDPLIQYGDAVAAASASPHHLRAAWSALLDPGIADLVLLRKVRAEARLADILAGAATLLAEHKAPFIDLRIADAGADPRPKEVRRLHRRLGEHGAVRLEIAEGDRMRELARLALTLKHQWLMDRGLTSAVVGQPCWEEALLSLRGEAGGAVRLVAACLHVGEVPAAIELALVHNGCWYAYLGAIEPAFSRWGPGRVQTSLLLERCRAEGLTRYDLMAPADAYKRGLMSDAVEVRDYIAPLTLRGHLAVRTAGLVPSLKAMLGRVPPGLCKAVLAPLRRVRGRSTK